MGRKGVLRAKTCELGMALGQSVGESITWFGNGGWVGGVGALRSTIAAQAGRVCVCVHVWVLYNGLWTVQGDAEPEGSHMKRG